MLLGHRLLLLGVCALPFLNGCGSSSFGSESGTIAAPVSGSAGPTTPVTPPKASGGSESVTGTNNAVAATPSVAALSVAVGGHQAVTVTLTSSDGKPITGFAISGSLGSLPPGWSGPSEFSCATVGPGEGCVVSLQYAPLAAASGTLTLNCVYVDNSGLARTPGPCAVLTYAAPMPNDVVAYASPAGEIDAIAGSAKQPVSINFTTDDGNAATNFALSVGALPAGWSSPMAMLTCAVVSTGSGCRLPLSFAPSASASGTLALSYTYIDNSGAARSGVLNVPYASIAHDTVTASVAPSGQINAAQTSGTQSVAVTFITDDGQPASGLSVTSDLTKLPPGWSSTAKTFACDSVAGGNGCQLHLSYAPTSLGGGTLSLSYAYTDAGGAANTGLVNLDYAATTDDNVVATVSPTGEINAMLGAASQPVIVNFSTDDSRLATALVLTSSLTTLPNGWSSGATSFSCDEFIGGSTCQLTLMYAPMAVDNGTLNLSYGYVNNAGISRMASLSIPYRTTTNDNVVGTANPLSVSAVIGSSNTISVTFTTDDGNFASGLSADLSALPMDWSSASNPVTCTSVSVGNSCQVTLTYLPTVAASATLSFGFTYVNNAGTTQAGTVSIPYTATP